MSLWISIETDEGEWNDLDFNVTYNLTPMFRLAFDGPSLAELLEKYNTPTSSIRPLRRGIRYMLENPEACKKLNPANGWGDYDGALVFLQQLLSLAETRPEGVWSLSK